MNISRRTMLTRTGAVAGVILASGTGVSNILLASADSTDIDVHSIKTISNQPQYYFGWPTLARRANGELLVVCSGGREAHVCPFGRVELIRSSDNGKNWSHPRVILDGPIDDRDAGILVTSKGTILVTTFTSLAYDDIYIKTGRINKTSKKNRSEHGKIREFSEKRQKMWFAAHNRITAEERKKELGCWMIRSTDGGITWSQRYSSILNSPHGPVQLSDGRLLYPGVGLWEENRRVGVCESTDDGQTWNWLSAIPVRKGDDPAKYHELHGVEAADGTIVVQIRNHNKKNNRETLQCESSDGGKTWSEPHSIDVWGLPSHLVRLNDNRLLMTYGHRRKPLGNQARISDDNGKTWSRELIIQGDAISGDLGYPSTVQLDDGSLISVWYELTKEAPKAILRQAHWSLKS